MSEQTFTHRDLARELGVSETTIKSYRSKFPTFLPVAREGKPVRLHAEALPVCRRIRDLFADGLSIIQTSNVLKSEFKEYPYNRRLSIADARRSSADRVFAVAPLAETERRELTERIAVLTHGQEQARKRMEQLETEVRNLATMEAASKALVAELVAELRAARAAASPAPSATARTSPDGALTPPASPRAEPPQAEPPRNAGAPGPAAAAPEPSVVMARKIVTVHGAAGPVATYALAREPKPAPPFPEPETPALTFLSLPAVIRSDRGDFLGLPGGQSVRRLVEVLAPGSAGVSWFTEGPDAWTCAIPLGHAQKREILFERTTTPRGNQVGLIRRMRVNEIEATPMQLQEIFRQLRDQMA